MSDEIELAQEAADDQSHEDRIVAECCGCETELEEEQARDWMGKRWCLACAGSEASQAAESTTLGYDALMAAATLVRERADEIRRKAMQVSAQDNARLFAPVRVANAAIYAQQLQGAIRGRS